MYYAININEYRQEDIPSLKRLWTETFGDAPELVDRFFELLPSMGTGLVAESGTACSRSLGLHNYYRAKYPHA